MTAPGRPTTLGRPADQDQRDQQVLTFEHALEAAALAALLTAINGAIGMALALVSSGLPATVVRPRLVAALRALPVDVEATMRQRWPQGVTLGVSHALGDVPGAGPVSTSHAEVRQLAATVTPADADTASLLTTVDRDLRAGLDRAARLAETVPLETPTDVTVVQAKAVQAVNQTKAQITWLAQAAVSAGTIATAKDNGTLLCWVAERDACETCLALSGQVVEPGEQFDVDATFADKPMPMFPINDPAPLLGPPRHSHCRCSLRLFTGDPTSPTGLPAALRREAERSVARGFSNYASKRARLRAADRLVRRANRLPKTVNARAKQDVARGDFSPRHNQNLPALPPGR